MAMTFADIFGQDEALSVLHRALGSDRLPHGLLLAGPPGVGKGTIARLLARRLLCEAPSNAEPCNRCHACTLCLAETHPDLHIVYRQLIRLTKSDVKAREIVADVIRDYVLAPAGLRTVMGRGKVFIIEEAELMNTAAQNALLKTLEEPSPGTTIILLTHRPGDLLPTIRSRCQLVQFAKLPEHAVRRQIEQRGYSSETALKATQLADGSLGQALRWIEDGVVEQASVLIDLLDELWQGRISATRVADFFKPAIDAYAERQLARDKLGSKDQASRDGIAIYLSITAAHFARKLRDGIDPDALERACRAIDALVDSERYVDANVNAQLVYLQLSSALRRARPIATR
jgi:DNA polymerase-3 subunit delta'